MVWLEVVGWAGSVLVVVSLMQARVWRFRVLNLVGSLLATAYNAVFGIWAFVAMNGAISLVNVYWLWRLRRERGDARVYAVVEVAPDDAYLRHVLAVHADDVARHRAVPARDVGPGDGDELAFLVVRGDETVGVVLVRDSGGGTGVVLLDWVTPRFRDFTPGEFVYRGTDVFAAHGLDRLVVPTAPPGSAPYLARVGFRRVEGDAWERAVAA
ncbi:YgjV family protein [Cellulomonas shaoxiangyii]|uniref:YgjV family protein n=1 Tax=Cellulomonas shaoxiangyii TaxID=2566013 RepID=UPI001094259D|nr:YgjV family protein [Cellulomonas shaoxiangyii]TGY86563.1 hypothetical protein E5226_01980 [Cellulomonas shaoxiangyii]